MGYGQISLVSGRNYFDRRLGNFRVQIQPDDEGLREARLTASVLAPPHLTERERSSGIPSTVDISTPFPEALKLAAEILRLAKGAGIPLPKGIALRWNFPIAARCGHRHIFISPVCVLTAHSPSEATNAVIVIDSLVRSL